MKERIIAYLAHGLSEEKIVNIVGCDPSYIVEIKSASDFDKLLVEEKKKIERDEAETVLETRYNKLERATLHQIEQNLPFAEFHDLTKLMDSLIKRKQAHAVPPPGSITNNIQNNNVILLQVPKAAVPELQLNAQREVIAINGKTLAPMPSTRVKEIFAERAEKAKLNEATDAKILEEKKFEEDQDHVRSLPSDF